MPDIILRPTTKFIRAAYVIVVVLIAAAFAAWIAMHQEPAWVPAVLAVLFLLPMRQQIRRQSIKVTIGPDKLRYESGLLGKTTRTLQLAKIQDVRVEQSFGQRLLGIGNLSIETAGEASRLTVASIDRPQEIADEIMRRSEQAGIQRSQHV